MTRAVVQINLFLPDIFKELKFKLKPKSYRLAPDFAYPAATEDCYAVTKYILKNAHIFNADLDRLILAGDSAGIVELS